MGAAIAVKVAEKAKSRVASLTLIAPAGLGPEINGAYITGFVKGASRRDMKPVLELLFANRDLVSRQLIDDVLKFKRLDGVEKALGQLGEALFGGGKQSDNVTAAAKAAGVPVTRHLRQGGPDHPARSCPGAGWDGQNRDHRRRRAHADDGGGQTRERARRWHNQRRVMRPTNRDCITPAECSAG